MASRVSEALAEISRRYGLPVDPDAERPPMAPAPTHGTARELVMARIEAGEGDTVPQGLLDLAGLTREGLDASASALARATAAAGVPEEFRDVPPDRSRLAAMSADPPRGAWLCGDVGRSKTRTACAWLRAWLSDRPGTTALFATEDSMLGAVKSAFDRRDVDAEEVLGRYVSADLLVLDDMGKARLSAWGISQVFRVVDGRWAGRRPTVYTSQHTLAEWGELAAQSGVETARACVSRVYGCCDVIRFDGPDGRVSRRDGIG